MARARSVFCCTECGTQQPRYLGRCPGCGGWETLVEEPVGGVGSGAATAPLVATGKGSAAGRGVVALAAVDADAAPRIPSGLPELDRVLGGGLVPGSVVLIGGEPGIGKSTLSLQIAARRGGTAGALLYVTGEESLEQVRLRAERLGDIPPALLALSETRLEALAAPWREHRPEVVVIDSIQTLRTDRVESAAGSVAQVRECAAQLAATAKSEGTVLILVGHVTKEGTLAGPRVLEHLVDVVLTFEGDRGTSFRLLRATKNRFGSTQEVGIFTMGEKGLDAVENPSELFLAERHAGAPGSCIVPIMEGTRPVLLEVQALVAPAGYGTARRTTIGIDDARVALLLAVLDRHSEIDLLSCDVYVNVVGGVRVAEPAADLGVALALASSRLDRALPSDVAACGEVGLGGEVRRVARLDQRLREAGRLGFGRVLVPTRAAGDGSLAEMAGPRATGVSPVGIAHVGEAVRWLFENAGTRPREHS